DGASMRYGTTLPTLEFPSTGAPAFAPGVTVNTDFRTNVGCFNETAAANHVDADIYDGEGHELSTVSLDLPAHAWGQEGVKVDASGGLVKFETSGPADCYAVVVSNPSGDGRLIPAVEYTP